MPELLEFIAELINKYPRVFEVLFIALWMVVVVWYYDHLNDTKKRNTKALRSLISSHSDKMYYDMITNAKKVVSALNHTCNGSCDVDVYASEFGAFEGQVKAMLRKDHIEEVFRSLYENGFGNYGLLKLDEYKKNKGATIGQNGRMRIGIYENQFPHIAGSKKCDLNIDMNIAMYGEVVDQYLLNKKTEVPFWKIMAKSVPFLKKIIFSS